MLKGVSRLRIASRLALTLLVSGPGSAVCVLVAGGVGLVLAPAASPGPALGSIAAGDCHGCAIRAEAEKHRIPVEQDKPETERGRCLYPEACGGRN